MQLKTPAIVLSRLRYRENRLIVNLYSANSGLLNGIFYQGKKNPRISLLEPLSVVEVVIDQKPNRELQDIKELRLIHPLTGIRSDIRKSAIAMFISEITLACTRNTSPDNELFDYMVEMIDHLDMTSEPHYFPVEYLAGLCKYLGIGPDSNFSALENCFNPATGRFSTWSDGLVWNENISRQLNEVLTGIKPKGNLKNLLNALIDYMGYQLNMKTNFKSGEVIGEVFA